MHQILEHFNWTATTVCRHWFTGIVSDLISSSWGYKIHNACQISMKVTFEKHSYPKNMTARISVCTLPGDLKIIDISQNFTYFENQQLCLQFDKHLTAILLFTLGVQPSMVKAF